MSNLLERWQNPKGIRDNAKAGVKSYTWHNPGQQRSEIAFHMEAEPVNDS